MFSSLDGADAGAIAASMTTSSQPEGTFVHIHVSPNGDGQSYRVFLTGEDEKSARSVLLADVPGEIAAMGVIHSHKVRWMRALLSLLPNDKAWSVEVGTLHAWSNARATDEAVIKAIRWSMEKAA